MRAILEYISAQSERCGVEESAWKVRELPLIVKVDHLSQERNF